VVEQHVQEGGDYQFYNNNNNNISYNSYSNNVPADLKKGPTNYQKE
jgi:hypothetical protein